MQIIESIKLYFIGSYRELKKVSWPTKKQTINYSTLVVAMSIGVALLFSVLDYVFELIFKTIIK